MNKLSSIVFVALAGLSVGAYAAHGGAGGSHMGGMASSHMSTHGMENTNGPNAADRSLGLDRAGDRRNVQGTSHENAEVAQGKHKHSSQHGKNRQQ